MQVLSGFFDKKSHSGNAPNLGNFCIKNSIIIKKGKLTMIQKAIPSAFHSVSGIRTKALRAKIRSPRQNLPARLANSSSPNRLLDRVQREMDIRGIPHERKNDLSLVTTQGRNWIVRSELPLGRQADQEIVRPASIQRELTIPIAKKKDFIYQIQITQPQLVHKPSAAKKPNPKVWGFKLNVVVLLKSPSQIERAPEGLATKGLISLIDHFLFHRGFTTAMVLDPHGGAVHIKQELRAWMATSQIIRDQWLVDAFISVIQLVEKLDTYPSFKRALPGAGRSKDELANLTQAILSMNPV